MTKTRKTFTRSSIVDTGQAALRAGIDTVDAFTAWYPNAVFADGTTDLAGIVEPYLGDIPAVAIIEG